MASRFVASAPAPHILPDLGLTEVAFIGRSNVGKSSLLGMVLGDPKLVRRSKTPGRTQSLNLFTLDERLALVDLPGYGYAKLSKTQRASLSDMIHRYIAEREPLAGVVLLVDPRLEELSPLDREMSEEILRAGRQVLLVITKSDLIPKNRLGNVVRRIEEELGVPRGSALPCSAKTGTGRSELVRSLIELTA